jgi:hypothetical protein
MLAVVGVATPFVVTGNVVLVAPAATDTLAGTEAAALSLARLTLVPLAGAALLNVTVPVLALPPVTLDGERDTPDRTDAAGTTVSVVVI